MQFVTIGRDQNGRSYVEGVKEVLADNTGNTPVTLDRLWSTKEFPPELPVLRRRADEHPRPTSVRDRTSMWTVARFGPDQVIDMHCTETLDYQTVLEGSVTLGLEDGAVELSRGDMVMIPGLLHAWTAGPEGCVISAITLRLTAV